MSTQELERELRRMEIIARLEAARAVRTNDLGVLMRTRSGAETRARRLAAGTAAEG